MTQPSALLLFTIDRVVRKLCEKRQLEMDQARLEEVVFACATQLSEAGMGTQLVDALSKALLASEHVVELYADDAAIKALITEVGEP